MTNLLLSVSSVLNSVLYIFLAICVLLFMIMIHEFGHYTAGKLLKFKINEFSIGFGKAIFSKTKKNGEKFSVRIFPLGGYCAFEGEDEDKKDAPDAFNSQKPWKRLIVLFSGAFFNFLSALIFAVIFLMAFGYNDRVQVVNVANKPAEVLEENWLKSGDVIHAINGKETNFVYDEYFSNLVSGFSLNEEFTVSVFRDGKNVDLKIYKSYSTEIKTKNFEGKLFVSLNGTDYNFELKQREDSSYYLQNTTTKQTYDVKGDEQKYVIIDGTNITANITSLENASFSFPKIGVDTQNYRYTFFEALGQTFVFCFGWAWKILLILWQLLTGQLALTSLGGTVTTVVTIAEVAQANIASLLLLIPLFSINLAVFNLLPFPALDGARMVFVAIEGIFKKPINRRVEGMIHFVGLLVLLGFVLLVDILHFVL